MTARSLVLLRHAKADTPPRLADDKRPLSARGQADAQAAGAWLAARGVPELVLCSPTKRTRQTWHAVSANLKALADPVVRYERRLYLGGADELLEMVREIEDPVSSVLLIGHNPTLSQLAFDLDPDGGLDSDGLRTCGLTVHSVDGLWAECGPRQAPITAIHTARGDR
jgi:phosphohistidine phosphatase